MLSVLDALAVFGSVVPTPVSTVDPELVTPGPWGFGAIALITVAVILLVWDMLRRVRRGRYRAEVREELDAQERDADGAQDPPTR
ncbi:hypothetical protein [Microbacterium wangruii]|uniref:hypothetical protein n=1 Tax=Microbacterium wangruii TaxID=3049073 RepID=UPI00256ECEB1|nr:hypothetical protein [Microbacterium sp. zg-Y1211]MDL5486211.1 hypothetical protein [Microbacterium sp. zg-Y1211]